MEDGETSGSLVTGEFHGHLIAKDIQNDFIRGAGDGNAKPMLDII